MNDKNLENQINKELNQLEKKSIVLIKSDQKYYSVSVINTLKFILDKGIGGVYISTLFPYYYIQDKFNKYNIDTQNLFFIDTISCMAGESPGEHGRCAFIKNPKTLEDVLSWSSTMIDRLGTKNKFLCIDSVTNILIYNDLKTLNKFSKSLIDCLRSKESGGFTLLYLVGDGAIGGFYKPMDNLCDKTIKI